jgi:hypothetical protein
MRVEQVFHFESQHLANQTLHVLFFSRLFGLSSEGFKLAQLFFDISVLATADHSNNQDKHNGAHNDSN